MVSRAAPSRNGRPGRIGHGAAAGDRRQRTTRAADRGARNRQDHDSPRAVRSGPEIGRHRALGRQLGRWRDRSPTRPGSRRWPGSATPARRPSRPCSAPRPPTRQLPPRLEPPRMPSSCRHSVRRPLTGRWCSSSTTCTGPTRAACSCSGAVAGQLPGMAVLVVGTYRDTEVLPGAPLTRVGGSAERFALRPFDLDRTRDLLADSVGCGTGRRGGRRGAAPHRWQPVPRGAAGPAAGLGPAGPRA